MKKVLVAMAVLAGVMWACEACLAQTVVTGYVPGVTAEGVTYYLPRTQLVVTIRATRVTRTPGDLKDYARRYLRLDDVPQETTTEWMLDDVWITPVGVPDVEKVYSILLDKKTVAPLVDLTPDGIILSINTRGEVDEAEKVEIVNETADDKLNSRDYMTEEILYAGNRSKMAELCSEEIYDLRESRNLLVKGQADYMPTDGEQLKLMLEQLETQEKALLQLFEGTTETEVKTFQIEYDPVEAVEKEVLFRFSRQFGVVDKDDLSGEPVYIDVENLETVPQRVETVEKKESKDEQNAVRYNVPGSVYVDIYDATGSYASLTTPMGQFGQVEVLSNALFNKRNTTCVTFYSTTGGLKKLTDSGE